MRPTAYNANCGWIICKDQKREGQYKGQDLWGHGAVACAADKVKYPEDIVNCAKGSQGKKT
jgi:hypothetical protein